MADLPDYSNLKVADLRALLKERGIPSTGLTRKQQIIEKLEEVDRMTDASQLETIEDPDQLTAEGENAVSCEESGERMGDVPAVHAFSKPLDQAQPSIMANESSETMKDDNASTVSSITLPREGSEPPVQKFDPSVSQTPVPSHEDPLPVPNASQDATTEQSSGQPSRGHSPSRLNPEEILEDSRKRKRRSATPPIDAQEIANKKLKQMEQGEAVRLKEDENDVAAGDAGADVSTPGNAPPANVNDDLMEVETKDYGVVAEQATEAAFERAAEIERSDRATKSPQENRQQTPPEGAVTEEVPSREGGARQESRAAETQEMQIPEPPRPPSPPTRASLPTATSKSTPQSRYRSVLKSSIQDSVSQTALARHVSPPSHQDREIAPALHAATAALYIRNFMRPLKPENLKEHLTKLATPPSTDGEDCDVVDFYLDPIRTHCFVRFSSLSAAARVRTALHGAVWPQERDRKQLWADYVPEEKMVEWIATERSSANGGRGGVGKKYEVVYENVDNGIRAAFKEVGQSGPARRESNVRVPGAPLGPRGRSAGLNHSPINPPTRENAAPLPTPATPRSARQPAQRGFATLDSLFKSTSRAKPKLYYMPVSDEKANARLDALRRATSFSWRNRDARPDEELRKYTFNGDNQLRDIGAYRFRGGGAAAGGGRGGYRGVRDGGGR